MILKEIYYTKYECKDKIDPSKYKSGRKKISSFAEDVFILLQVLHQCNLIQAYASLKLQS